jgi:protein TonB
VTAEAGDEPVFGTTMESTSTAGTGPALPVGNTPRPEVGSGSAAPVKHVEAPVQAFEATKMPLPQGHCYGKYNDDALKAGIEGTVVLDLVVGDDGRVRDIKVVQGLGHGLDEAALTALRACQFSPGEKDGKPVAVRIRGFKITFVLPDQ